MPNKNNKHNKPHKHKNYNTKDRNTKVDHKKRHSHQSHIKASIPVEYILYYLYQHHGLINLHNLDDNFLTNHLDSLIDKIDLLVKKDLLINIDTHTFQYNYQLLNVNTSKYAFAKIKKSILKNHFLVELTDILNPNTTKSESVIINNLKNNLKNRVMVVETILDHEKIILNPIFYCNYDEVYDFFYNHEIPQVANTTQPNTNTTQHILPDLDISNNYFRNKEYILGLVKKTEYENYLLPIDHKNKNKIIITDLPEHIQNSVLVKVKLSDNFQDNNLQESLFIELVNDTNATNNLSLLSIYQYNLRSLFPLEAIEEAREIKNLPLTTSNNQRQDISHLNLVTIDGEDAKDFDDAVYAEYLPNEDKYRLYVAIADVSYYVTPGSHLDKEAFLRGNSVYLPQHVLPMLPEELSNNICSLKPQQDRACVVAQMTINRNGILEDYQFYRAIMKSSARLTYNEVYDALFKQQISDNIQPLMENVIKPLKNLYDILAKVKQQRNALEITSVEHKVNLDNNQVVDIYPQTGNIAHKIIEECMILANVAAVKYINQYTALQPLNIYRVHPQPTIEKINNYINELKTFGIKLKAPSKTSGKFFNDILYQYQNSELSNILNQLTLRSQSQAKYDNNNIGHFGLSLTDYGHFTSPIRRYADLITHRLLISCIDEQAKFKYSKSNIKNICDHINFTEQVAFLAENKAKDRLIAQWLTKQLGTSFSVYVSSITKAGLFVNIVDLEFSGLIPMRTLSKKYSHLSPKQTSITIHNPHKKKIKIGDRLPAILTEADYIKGLLTFKLKV